MVPELSPGGSAKAVEFQAAPDRKDSKAFAEGFKNVYRQQENGISPALLSDGNTLHTEKKEIILQ